MSNLSSSPLNFQRFLDMQRPTTRSLSPEDELRQMTITSSLRDGPVDHFPNDVTDTQAAANGATQVATRSLRNPLNEARALAAVLWQYGSPLYYPPTKAFYCWSQHLMASEPQSSYAEDDVISCDFCGLSTSARDGSANGSKPAAKKMVLRSRKAKVESISEISSFPAFLHCTACDIHLCEYCAADIRDDDRYHIPCLQCESCRTYCSLNATEPHQCAPKEEQEAVQQTGVKREEEQEVQESDGRGAETTRQASPPRSARTANARAPPAAAAASGATPKRVHKTKEEQQARAERRAIREAKRAAKALYRLQRLTARITRLVGKGKPVPPALTAKRNAAAAHPDLALAPQADTTVAAPAAPAPPPSRPTAAKKAKAPPPRATEKRQKPMPTKRPPAPPVGGGVRGRTKAAAGKRQRARKRARSTSEDESEESVTSANSSDEEVQSDGETMSANEKAEESESQEEAHSEDSLPVLSRAPTKTEWLVTVSLVNAEDKDEVRRIARELNLVTLAGSTTATSVVFVLRTRLAAEKCAQRANDADLETALRKA